MISESLRFFKKIMNCSQQSELFQHTHLDLILTNDPYKGTMYSGVLLNSY